MKFTTKPGTCWRCKQQVFEVPIPWWLWAKERWNNLGKPECLDKAGCKARFKQLQDDLGPYFWEKKKAR